MTIKTHGFKKIFSLLMILGGALGNIFDRIFYKAVPDFIDFHVGIFIGLYLMLQIYLLL